MKHERNTFDLERGHEFHIIGGGKTIQDLQLGEKRAWILGSSPRDRDLVEPSLYENKGYVRRETRDA